MAVLILLGVGISSYPTRRPEALRDYFGSEHSESLECNVEALCVEALHRPDIWSMSDHAAGIARVEAAFRWARPERSPDAIHALGWYAGYAAK